MKIVQTIIIKMVSRTENLHVDQFSIHRTTMSEWRKEWVIQFPLRIGSTARHGWIQNDRFKNASICQCWDIELIQWNQLTHAVTTSVAHRKPCIRTLRKTSRHTRLAPRLVWPNDAQSPVVTNEAMQCNASIGSESKIKGTISSLHALLESVVAPRAIVHFAWLGRVAGHSPVSSGA